MTPKEKAIELYNKFRKENPVMAANVRAKKQSLIAVQEIIDTFIYVDPKKGYWHDVKEEIQKL